MWGRQVCCSNNSWIFTAFKKTMVMTVLWPPVMTSLQTQLTYYNTVMYIFWSSTNTLDFGAAHIARFIFSFPSLQIPLCNPSHCIGGVPTLVTLWKCGVQLTDTALQCFCDYYSLELCTSFARTAYHAHQKMIQVGTKTNHPPVVCYSISSCLNFGGF